VEGKNGIPLVQESVTAAAHLVAQLSRNQNLDERDRANCRLVLVMLEASEKVLYGK